MSLVRPCYTGFGDKILDLIGLAVVQRIWCDRYPTAFLVMCNGEAHWWGEYAPNLVTHRRVQMITNSDDIAGPYSVVAGSCGCSVHPLKISELTGAPSAATFDMYKEEAGFVSPSDMVGASIPSDLRNCIGVHLRRGDKVNSSDTRLCTSNEELHEIMQSLKAHVAGLGTKDQAFFVCSDDATARADMQAWLVEQGGLIRVAGEMPDVKGLPAVVDFFSLSRCRMILQGIGYSTFSLAASVVGGVPLHNYWQRARWDEKCFLRWWAPVVDLFACARSGPFTGHVRDLHIVEQTHGACLRSCMLPSRCSSLTACRSSK